jgi:V-type H+-transporting ATPase subunit D
MDREEFFRLKKVKGVKEKAQAVEEAERRKKIQQEKEAAAKEEKTNPKKDAKAEAKAEPEKQEESKNVLGDDGDEDLIF